MSLPVEPRLFGAGAGHRDFEGVRVDATVGISHPTWAAEIPETDEPVSPGTINLVIETPVGLDPERPSTR